LVDSTDCVVHSPDRVTALLGVRDLLIVDTPDALLVADKSRDQDVKRIVEILRSRRHAAVDTHVTCYRPWGSYTVLEEGDHFKIKRIVVKPKEKLSLQMHHHRSEHWIVVSGTALVHVGGEERLIMTNASTFIPAGETHRLSNPGVIDLHLIEVQSGAYLGEDDIVRFEDIYGRALPDAQSEPAPRIS
ncbi:cupin domain-containing protein, partial [Acidithiobacillus ferriphilus]